MNCKSVLTGYGMAFGAGIFILGALVAIKFLAIISHLPGSLHIS